MPRRLTNDLLLTLVLLQVLSGLLGWALPVSTAAVLYPLHRLLGVAIIVLLGWKQAIAVASLRRRVARRRRWDRSVLWGSLAALALLMTLGLGLAWTSNLISFDLLWGYSPMSVHVALGIGCLPLLAVHMLRRRRQNAASSPVLSRRSALRIGGLAIAALFSWQAIDRLAPGLRSITGSKQTASLSGNAFPSEIWLLDGVPSVDQSSWRLRVLDKQLSLQELAMLHQPRQTQTVLDCTGGWWSEQVWSGVGVLDVLREAGLRAGSVTDVAFVSLTGHRIVLAVDDLDDALLATAVGGETLSAGHGYPLRLVVPGRRGYQWVKWLASIEPA